MNSLHTLMVLLSATGILSSAIAPERISSPEEQLEKSQEKKCEGNGVPPSIHGARVIRQVYELIKFSANFRAFCSFHPFPVDQDSGYDEDDACSKAHDRDEQKIVTVTTNSVMEFLCQDDGNLVARFAAAGVSRCFDPKLSAIMKCIYKDLSSNIGKTKSRYGSHDTLIEQCIEAKARQNCLVETIEDCEDPTSANLVGSVFDHVNKNVLPCSGLSNTRLLAGNQQGNYIPDSHITKF